MNKMSQDAEKFYIGRIKKLNGDIRDLSISNINSPKRTQLGKEINEWQKKLNSLRLFDAWKLNRKRASIAKEKTIVQGNIDFAKANYGVEIGDVVTDSYGIRIIVDHVSVNALVTEVGYECIYSGPLATTKNKPRADKMRDCVSADLVVGTKKSGKIIRSKNH